MTEKERREAIEYLKKYKELDKQLYQTAPFTSVAHSAIVKCLKHWDTAIQSLQESETIQDKQAESEKYQKAFDDGYENGYAQARFDYEQKPGEWLITPMSHMAYCSKCDYLFKDIPTSIVKHFKHCPNCGVHMKGTDR